MNLHKKIAFTTVLVAILAFSGTPSAMASTSGHDRSAFNSSAEVALQEKLSNIASTNNLDVEFGEFKIDAPQSTIDEYHGDANLYAESIAKAYEEDTASNTRETKNASTRGTATYTSSVFSGVPAGGACWVKQDFRATVTNYKVLINYICLFDYLFISS